MSKNAESLEKIYEYIKDRIEKKGSVPTQSEIARDCEFSIGTVQSDLSKLEAQGRITRTAFQSRSIRLVSENDSEQENETAELVYDYLLEKIEEGIHPTQYEIANACFLSRRGVRQTLLWLEAQGRIERGRGQRNICLPEEWTK